MIKIRTLKVHNFKQLKEIRLKFPDHGSVLVEGRNEAGKSTLFEAIYFGLYGDALVTEDNRNDLKDLIEYSASMAVVELGIEVRGRFLRITRTIHREKPNAWRLSIFGSDGEEELIRKNTAVNERIIREIGLDGDALLNSCFVEQKKLEKLEGLNAADRRKSLLRILNLEALEELQNQFKRRREDELRLSELHDRVKLSEVLEQIPALEIEKAELEHNLTLFEMKSMLTAIEERRRQIEAARAVIEKLAPEQARLKEQSDQIQRFKEGQQTADKIIVNLQRIDEWEREITEVEEQERKLAVLEEALPEKELRRNSLLVIAGQFSRLERIREAADEARRELKSLQEQLAGVTKLQISANENLHRIQEARQQFEENRREETRLAELVKVADQKEALEGWRRSKSTEDGLRNIKVEESDIKAEAAKDEERRLRESQNFSMARGRMFGCAGACMVLLISAIVSWFALGQRGLAGIAVTGFVGLVYLALSHYHKAQLSRRSLAAIADALRGHQENLLRLEGQIQSLQRAGESGNGKLAYYEEILHGLQVKIPDTLKACDEILAGLESGLEGHDISALRTELATRRESIAAQEATLREMESQHAHYERELQKLDEASLLARKSLLEKRHAKAIKIAERRSNYVQERTKTLETAQTLQEIREQAALLREEILRNRKEISQQEEFSKRAAARRASVEELHGVNEKLHPAIQAADGRAPDWTRETTQGQYQRVSRYYASRVKELDELGTNEALQELERKSHAAQGEISAHGRDIGQRTLRLAETCRKVGVLLPEGEIQQEALEERLPALRNIPQDDAPLRRRRDEAAGELVHLERQRQDLTLKLRLEGVNLERETCEHELWSFDRDLKVRPRAEQIVKQAREQLVAKVLPSTIEHMRRILPVLTMDRYHDAEITEDYQIKAWDERAGGWKAKNIFSGGTKDQFSLALRLAFALATLPQERGAAPGFIFLDEPLSSFDKERSLALMELITSGEIAGAFDQILVISHSQVLDSTMFHHHLVLEDGRVAFSTLEPLEDAS